MGNKLSRDELVALVASIQKGEGTEEEIAAKVTLLESNVPDPNVSDLIFYADLTPEDVVRRAFQYKPTCL